MRSLLALLLLGVLLKAQTAASDPIDPEKAALVRQIVQASSSDALKKQILSMTALFRNTLLRQNPKYPAGYGDEFQKKFAGHIQEEDLVQLSIPIYAKTFSVEELKQILAFHLSPVGQKLAASQPEILAETVQASLRYARQMIPDINREIIAEHPEWKEQIGESVGANGNSPPRLISQAEPQLPYGESPKSGTVMLFILIDENGVPQDAQVARSLGPGFDQKAIEAVQKWRFQPGMRNGVAVKTKATVEVNFRVVSKQ